MTQTEKIKLLELAREIEIHDQLDFEITLAGSPVNAWNATQTMNAILDVLGIPRPVVTAQDLADWLRSNNLDPRAFRLGKL